MTAFKCFAVQKAFYREMLGHGHLSEQTYRNLVYALNVEGDSLRYQGELPRVPPRSQFGRWWRNLRGGDVAVEVEIARQRQRGTAVVHEGDTEPLREGVRRFIAALPRDAKVYGLKLDADKKLREDSLAAVAPNLVLVEIRLA